MKRKQMRRLGIAVLAMLFCGANSYGVEAAETYQKVSMTSKSEYYFYLYYDTEQFNNPADSGNVTYKYHLSAKTLAPTSGSNALVTSGQVYTFVKDQIAGISGGGVSFKENLVVEASAAERSETDTSKKNTIVDSDNKVLATFKTASIASGDTGFVSGGDLYGETRANLATAGNYISAQDAGANLTALDTAIGKVASAGNYIVAQDGTAATNVAANLSNLDTAIGKVASAGNYIVAQDGTAATNVAANLSKLDAAIGKTTAGNYIVASGMTTTNNVAANLSALDTKIGAEQAGNYYTLAATVEAKLKALDTKIGAAKTKDTDIYAAADDVETQISKVAGKLIQSVSNATSSGKTDAQTVTLTDYNGATKTFDIEGLGAVDDGDVRLLSGGTAYTYLSPTVDGHYIKTGATKTTAENLTALDTAIGKVGSGTNYMIASAGTAATDMATNLTKLDTAIGKVASDGHYIVAQDGTAATNVAANLSKLDTALYEHSKLVQSNATASASATKISVGSDADFSGVTEVSFGTSGGATRILSGVSKGTDSGQAASWDQVAASGKTIKLSTETREAAGSNVIQYNQMASNDGTVLATFQKMKEISSTDDGFVSGKDLYKELAVTESGSYVLKSNTTAENLLALDRAVSGGGIVRVGTENKTKIYVGLNPDGETTYSDVTSIDIGNGGTRTISSVKGGTTAGEAVEFSQINTVAKTQANGSYIQSTLKGDGTLNADGTVGANLAALDAKAVASASGTNVIDLSDTSKKLVANDGSTLATFTRVDTSTAAGLTSNDYGFVAGADLFAETRTGISPTGNNYIGQNQTAGANLTALDLAIGKTAAGTYISAQDGTSVTVATNLAALDTALAAQAKLVRVSTDDTTKILVGSDATHAGVTTIDVSNSGMTRTIAGVSRATTNGQAATWDQIAQEGQIISLSTTTRDVSGKDIQGNQIATNDGKVVATLSLMQSVGANDTGFVSGSHLYREVRQNVSGTYIAATNDVGTNLSNLDAAITEAANQSKIVRKGVDLDADKILIGNDDSFADVTTVSVAKKDGATRTISGVTAGTDNTDAANVGQLVSDNNGTAYTMDESGVIIVSNKAGGTAFKLQISGNGSIAEDNAQVISGGTAYAYLNPSTGSYVTSGATTAANLNALDSAIGKVATGGTYISAQDATHNVATNLQELDAAIATQSKIVRVGTEAEGEDTIFVGKDGTNETAFANVTTIDVGNGRTRTITGVAAGTDNTDAANVGQLVSDNNGTAYTMDESGVITVSNKAGGTAFKLQISGNGSIAEDNAQVISGGTAYAYLNPSTGSYVTSGATTAANLNALDSAIGKVATGGTYISAQDATHNVATNLQELDAAIYAQSKIVRVSKDDPTQILVGRDGEGDTTFAKVKTIDVSNGDTATRKITGVTAGGKSGEAAVWDQILASDQKIQLGLQDGNMTLKANDGTTTLATFTVTEAIVASGNIGIMTGNSAYAELRPMAGNYNYISDQATKTNLADLDAAIGVTERGKYISAQKSLKDGALVTVATNLKELDEAIYEQSKIVRVGGENSEKILIGRDDTGETTFANVKTIDVSNGEARTVTGVASGKADNEAVEFSQIQTTASAAQTNGTYLTSTLDDDGTLNAAGTVGANLAALDAKAVSTKADTNVINLSETSKKLVSNDGTTLATFTRMTKVAIDDFGFVSGADLYNELRVVGKKGVNYNYIDEENTTAENLKALDAAIKSGSSEATKLIKRDGDKILIGSDTEYDDVKSIDIGNGGTRILTGVGTGTANTDAANVGQIAKSGQTVNLGNTTTTVNGKTINANQIAANDGTVLATFTRVNTEDGLKSNDYGFVSGADLYNETRSDISSTNYISKTASAGANLSALDAQLAKVAKANTDAVADIQKDLKASDGSYVKAANKTGANLDALDTAIGTVEKDGHVIKASLKEEDKTLQTRVSQNLVNLDTKIGAIAEKTDGTEYTAISKDATISANLIALDDAISKGVTGDLTKVQKATKYADAKATGENAIALGNQSDSSGASALNAIALGTNAAATEESAVSVGTKAEAKGRNAMALGNGASASAADSVAIGSGSVASEANTVSVGSEGAERRITNVADGVNDTDAVNVGQLNRSFADLQSSLTADINKVGAGAAALAALRPEGFNPMDKISFSVGYGHYRSANAGALGVFYKPNADTTVSLGGTLGNGDSMMSAGVSFKLGSGSKNAGKYNTGAAVSQELSSLRKSNDQLSADNKSLKKDNAAQATAIKAQAKEIADLKADNEKIKADNERMQKQIAMILSKMEMSDTVKKTAAK